MDITTIKYPSHNDLVQWYYQLAQRISDSTGVTPEQVNELIDEYIAEHPYPVVPDGIITQANAAANVVTSVNGEKGDVTVIGGGDVPGNVITTDNIAQNAVTSFNGAKGAVNGVTSVNGRSGAVTVRESPQDVVTTSNIGAQAVTSFNGNKGNVSGVTSVNGVSGQAIQLGYPESGPGYVVKLSDSVALVVSRIVMQCVSQNPPRFGGVFPKYGYTSVLNIVSGEFEGDPTPFVPSGMELETSEGVWTIIFNGAAIGQQVTVGAQVAAWITLIVVA